MVFENELIEEPGIGAQVHRHLPIAVVAFGALTLMVSMHLAAVGVAIAAAAHVIVGLGLLVWRRRRSGAQPA